MFILKRNDSDWWRLTPESDSDGDESTAMSKTVFNYKYTSYHLWHTPLALDCNTVLSLMH